MPRTPIRWTKPMLKLLGTRPDAEIAERYAISPHAVLMKRHALGIPAAGIRRPSIQWTKRRLTQIGTMSDIDLAERMGISRESVRIKRVALGIQAWKEHAGSSGIEWHDPTTVASLGTMPDADLAKAWGVSTPMIYAMRKKHDIPSHASRQHTR